MRHVRSSGFTLLELMITVVILSIIVGIAYPAYVNYTIQTRRSDAQIGITQTANRLEKFFSACNSYTATIAGGSIAACSGLGQTDALSPDRHYTLAIAATDIAGNGTIATAFTITATPAAGSPQVGNGALRIDSTGVKQWDKADNGSFGYKWSDK